MRLLTVTEALWGAGIIGLIAFFLGTGSSPYSLEGLTTLVVGVAWPTAVLMGVWMFKQPVAVVLQNFALRIPDLEKAGKDGVSFARRQQSTRTPADWQIDIPPLEHPDGPERDAIQAYVGYTRDLFARANTPQNEAFQRLEKAFAVAALDNMCLWVASGIFKSQVALLMETYTRNDWFDNELTTKHYLDGAVRSGGYSKSYMIGEWTGYLVTQEMLEEDNGRYRITAKGRYFVHFLTEKNINWQNYAG